VNVESVYLKDKELARRWNISVALIRKMRVEKTGPPAVKIGRSIRYRIHEAEAWLDRQNAPKVEVPE
jgi:predicted DNA-binding transcriptional regulator AlpA